MTKRIKVKVARGKEKGKKTRMLRQMNMNMNEKQKSKIIPLKRLVYLGLKLFNFLMKQLQLVHQNKTY